MSLWRDIPGYEGFYAVSDDGVVRSYSRRDSCGRLRPARVMGQFGKQHRLVRLSKDGKAVGMLVHRAMLMAFVGPPEAGECALHSDGDYLNNTLSNLRWGSVQDNYDDSVKHGRRPPNWQKSDRANANDFDRVSDLTRQGYSADKVAEWTGFNRKTVLNLRRARSLLDQFGIRTAA